MDKKTFALNAIAEYVIDPTKCGYEFNSCVYLTRDSKKCVLGKFMKPDHKVLKHEGPAEDVFTEYTQKEILIPEAVEVLNTSEWNKLQAIHDAIAINRNEDRIETTVKDLGLFTYEEMMEYAMLKAPEALTV